MKVPSGKVYTTLDLKTLKLMAAHGFVQHRDQPFNLKSGILSNVYVFGRQDLTDHPELEWLAGRKICQVVVAASHETDNQPCLIGIPTAGTALAQAAAMVSYRERLTVNNYGLCHRIMREKIKGDHGVHNTWVNGKPETKKHTYWRVDNVVTNGESKLEAEEKLIADGYPNVRNNPDSTPCLIWIDRQQGAISRLKTVGYTRIHVCYDLLDLTFAFGELGLWPKSAVGAVEEEIRQHQFPPTSAA